MPRSLQSRLFILFVALVGTLLGCSENPPPTPPTSANPSETAATPSPLSPPYLLLTQVQFEMSTNAEGKTVPKPGAAKLVQLKLEKGEWISTIIEDPDSRVFHKAICRKSAKGHTLLTIGASDAHLKTWQWSEGKWKGKSHWKPSFGGKWDRLRDFEFGDVDHDGTNELIIATHDQGVIAVAEEINGEFKATEIYRKADTFIHEIEVGDTNGDKKLEFFATPSAPNRADFSQGGGVMMFQFANGKYSAQQVVRFPHRHAKEILVADMNQDGVHELYVSLEAESKKVNGKREVTQPLEILQLTQSADGKWKRKIVATLPKGIQARVLIAADLRGIGRPSLIATTMRDGIWEFQPTDGDKPWTPTVIDGNASGFELAAGVADLDQDGKWELYAAADNQDEVRSYRWNGTRYESEAILQLPKRDLTWTVEACY